MADVLVADAPTPPDVVTPASPTPWIEPLGEHQPAPRSWLDIAVPSALVVGTAATRLPRLSRPSGFVFDEIYYALDGADIVRRGIERGGVVHPPVGKWLIGGGIRLFGFTPFGWRSAALAAGCLVVLFTYLSARQLVGGRWLPALAGLLVALDGIGYTTGRVAMLDVFLALFTTAALWLLLVALRDPGNERKVMWCKWGTGVALGLGLATKWTALYLVAVCLVGFLVVHARVPRGPRPLRSIVATGLILTVLPLGIFVASYTPWLIKIDQTYAGMNECEDHGDCSPSIISRFQILWREQQRIWDFQINLKSFGNSNAAPGYTWLNQNEPAVLFRKTCIDELQQAPPELSDRACQGADDGDLVQIVAVANPVFWFTAMGAMVFVLAWAAWRRSILALVPLAWVAAQWLPWVIRDRHGYSFYLTPMMPPLALLVVIALGRHWVRRWAPPLLAAATIAAFGWLYPIWAGVPSSPDDIHAREYWDAY